MWTILRQRLAIIIIAIIGGMLLTSAGATARAADGAEGMTLLLAGSPIMAIVCVLAIGAIVAAFASVVGTLGNPIVGVFTVGVSLTIAAVYGGTIDATLRSAGASDVYWTLAIETLLWTIVMALLALLCVALSQRLSGIVPWRRTEPQSTTKDSAINREAHTMARRRHEAMDMYYTTGSVEFVKTGVGQPIIESLVPSGPTKQGWAQVILCTLVTALLGGAVASQLMQSEDSGQVVGALIGAMLIGGVVGHQMFPTRSALPAVLAPGFVGLMGHLWAAARQPAGDGFLAGYFDGSLSGVPLALPVFVLAAGMTGAAMGIGWSQAMMIDRYGMGEDEEIPEPHVEPEV